MGLTSTVICTRAEASLSILTWSGSIGLSMNSRIVLFFIGVLANYNKLAGSRLTGSADLGTVSDPKDVLDLHHVEVVP